MAAKPGQGFIHYTYTGKKPVVLDDHHEQYEIDFQADDDFYVKQEAGLAIIVHGSEPTVEFKAKTADRKYLTLMKNSEVQEFVFIPHPKHPSYPYIQKVDFNLIPKMYEYFNRVYFNNGCPKSLLFKKSRSTVNAAPFGLAEVRPNARAKGHFFAMTVNLTKISMDPILFVDVLLHEMIHLYLFSKGLNDNDRSILNDGHGENFQREMRRLNAKGFNISTVLAWEKREVNNAEYSVIFVEHPDRPGNAKVFWTLTRISESFDSIVAQVRSLDPATTYRVSLFETSEHKIRSFPQLGKNDKIPAAKWKLYYVKPNLKGRVIRTFDVHPSVAAMPKVLKVTKAEEPFYAMPFTQFTAWARRTHKTASEEQLLDMWSRFPTEKVYPHAFKELEDIHVAVDIGMKDADIRRRLNAVRFMFEGRISGADYRTKVREFLRKKGIEELLSYPQLGV